MPVCALNNITFENVGLIASGYIRRYAPTAFPNDLTLFIDQLANNLFISYKGGIGDIQWLYHQYGLIAPSKKKKDLIHLYNAFTGKKRIIYNKEEIKHLRCLPFTNKAKTIDLIVAFCEGQIKTYDALTGQCLYVVYNKLCPWEILDTYKNLVAVENICEDDIKCVSIYTFSEKK